MAQAVKGLLDQWFATNQSHWRAAVRRPASATKATAACAIKFYPFGKKIEFCHFCRGPIYEDDDANIDSWS